MQSLLQNEYEKIQENRTVYPGIGGSGIGIAGSLQQKESLSSVDLIAFIKHDWRQLTC
jgi:hypothetical protein